MFIQRLRRTLLMLMSAAIRVLTHSTGSSPKVTALSGSDWNTELLPKDGARLGVNG